MIAKLDFENFEEKSIRYIIYYINLRLFVWFEISSIFEKIFIFKSWNNLEL